MPRFAQKTKTEQHIVLYEEMIIFGGIIGGIYEYTQYKLPIPKILEHLLIPELLVIIFGFCLGVFVGSLAVSLAEILNVIPILCRRAKIKFGVGYFVLSIALGKMAGSLLYSFKFLR